MERCGFKCCIITKYITLPGAEELKIHIVIEYPAQCNLVAESKWLRIFGSLGVPLTIAVSHVPEPEECEE